MNGTRCGVAPDQANAGRPNCGSRYRSLSRALRTGPTVVGTREENTAMNRVRPPSTGSTYTMSADWSPVCGRAVTMLSIFTASTGLSARTGSPVKGEYSWVETTRVGAGCGCRGIVGRAAGLAGAAELDSAATSEIVNATTTATAGKPTRRAIRRRLLMAGLLIRERQWVDRSPPS